MCPKGHGGLYTRGICWPGAGPAKEFGPRMWTLTFSGTSEEKQVKNDTTAIFCAHYGSGMSYNTIPNPHQLCKGNTAREQHR